MDIEQHCIEHIPETERYGQPRRLFTLWFSSNFQVTTLVVGTLGIALGLSLLWSIVAIAIGVLIGSVFMAAHSAQGPHLGVPQMIQSRAQFGVYGAAVPLFVIVLSYVLFTAANGVVMRDSIKALLPVGDDGAIIIFQVLSLAIAFVGYELIHRIGGLMSVVSGVVFLGVLVVLLHHPSAGAEAAAARSGFYPAVFMLVITQAASWTIGFGPYVADYSRYLPENVSDRATFWYTYLGSVFGAGGVMMLGALLAARVVNSSVNPGGAIAGLFGSYSRLALIAITLGVLEINVLNVYSAFMSTTTIFTGFRGASRISSKTKFLVMCAVTMIATLIALATQYRFNDYFSDILDAQIYFLVPWSAINLVDYYFVSKGHYSVRDFFDVNGRYGKYNWATLAIYALAAMIQIPFVKLSIYQGAIARLIGADIAWIPALVVPAVAFAALSQRVPLNPVPRDL